MNSSLPSLCFLTIVFHFILFSLMLEAFRRCLVIFEFLLMFELETKKLI